MRHLTSLAKWRGLHWPSKDSPPVGPSDNYSEGPFLMPQFYLFLYKVKVGEGPTMEPKVSLQGPQGEPAIEGPVPS